MAAGNKGNERKTKIVSYQQLITPFSFVSVLPPLHDATKPVLFFFMMILVFGASILLLWERNQKSVTKLQTQDMASERSEISVANYLNFTFIKDSKPQCGNFIIFLPFRFYVKSS